MSKFRILLAAVLCMSLLAFTGCGEGNNADTNNDNGTVTEESTDMNDGGADNNSNNSGTDKNGTANGTNGDGSVMEDLGDAADDAVDDLERDAKDAADGMRNAVDGNNGEGPSNRDNSTKESNVGQ